MSLDQRPGGIIMNCSASPIAIGLDLGTGSAKAVAVDTQGRVSAATRSAIHTRHEGPHAEQSPEQVWQAAKTALGELAQALGRTGTRPDVLVLSGAMHSLSGIDGSGKPIAPATTWADQRTCYDLSDRIGSEQAMLLYQKTGCPPVALYHPARLRWRKEHDPRWLADAERLVSLTDYVAWRLTGQWATSRSLAAATGLLSLRACHWDDLALSTSNIPADRLPRVVQPTDSIGLIAEALADELSLPRGMAVLAGLSDGAAANLCADGLTGRCVMTLGTSGAVRRFEAEPRLDEHARTWCYSVDGRRWLVGQAMSNGGAVLNWLGTRLYPDLPADQAHRQMLDEAAAIPPGSGDMIVSPFIVSERGTPWPRELSGGLPAVVDKVLGISSGDVGQPVDSGQRGRIIRAAMEAVAAVMAVMHRSIRGSGRRPLRLTGRAAESPLWSQLLADMTGRPVQALALADGSALGAALLGQLAMDESFDLPGCVESIWATSLNYQPDPRQTAMYQEHRRRLAEGLGQSHQG